MRGKDIFVSPRGDEWIVQTAGSSRPAHVAPTQAKAKVLAKIMAKRNQSELSIQRRDGTIGEKNSYFKPDTFPPRG